MGGTRKLVALGGLAFLALLFAAGAPAQPQAGEAEEADLERGEKLYDLCVQCHGQDGGGMEMALAPAIAGLERWYVEAQLEKFQKGYRGGHFEDIAGMRMRPMSRWLDADGEGHDDRRDVSAYVATLPPANPERTLEGDPERGKNYYAPCTACHGPQGKGNQVLNAPGLVHSSDWYLVRSLEKYKQGVRGWNPEDATAQVMRGMAQSLPDEQAMKDVVAYIMSLRGEASSSADSSQTP